MVDNYQRLASAQEGGAVKSKGVGVRTYRGTDWGGIERAGRRTGKRFSRPHKECKKKAKMGHSLLYASERNTSSTIIVASSNGKRRSEEVSNGSVMQEKRPKLFSSLGT
jgi:hypothetical protein